MGACETVSELKFCSKRAQVKRVVLRNESIHFRGLVIKTMSIRQPWLGVVALGKRQDFKAILY